ncbi:hypothetical protein ACN6LF_001888 [[Kitasatospora] papulosa]|uniref:hypothetical protein n=1 Tax=[Kitasatospora] papulosa TaxID=1464011 RepID=UPI00403C9C81
MMRTRTAAAAALVLAVGLTACGTSGEPAATKSSVKASAPAHEVDCSDTSLSQAEWMESCSDEDAPSEAPSTGLAFGKPYAWPDGLEVTIIEAKVFTDWGEFEEPDPKNNEFRVRLKLDNKGQQAVNLSDITIMVDGATNGGTSSSSTFEKGSAPLEGRLAPGVSAVKTDDNALEKRYGKDVVITVQRTSEAEGFMTFPEFTGKIS